MRYALFGSTIVLCAGLVAFVRGQEPRSKIPASAHTMITPDAIEWHPVPQQLMDGAPAGAAQSALAATEVAILQGDPSKEGAPFVVRFRSAPGTRIPPHWHPIDENITV